MGFACLTAITDLLLFSLVRILSRRPSRTAMRRCITLLTITTLLTATPMAAHASPGAIAYWAMDEPAGSTRMSDSSGNGLDGQIGSEVGTGAYLAGSLGYRF